MQKICKCEVEYGTASYLYRKNLFGDVTEIYNEAGTLVGKYSYTAFGVCTVELDTSGIATKNPIRYRSYYYDDETELYYLKSRYYDPEVGRFITIDDISYLAPNIINGLNLYAYCGNNPVMNVDPNGAFPIIIGIIVAIFSAIFLTGCSSSVKETGITILKAGEKVSEIKKVVDVVQSTVKLLETFDSVEKVMYMHTLNVLGYGYYPDSFTVAYVPAFGGTPEEYLSRLEREFKLMQLMVSETLNKDLYFLHSSPEGVKEIYTIFRLWAPNTSGLIASNLAADAVRYAMDIYMYYWGLLPDMGVMP